MADSSIILRSVVANLRPRGSVRLPISHGKSNHGALLRQLATVDQDLASELHGPDDTELRSYTLSPITGPFAAREGFLYAQPGGDFRMRMTGYGPAGVAAVQQLVSTCERWEITFGRESASFEITDWHGEPGSDGLWCGALAAGELLETAALDAVAASDRIHLSFVSATTFSRRSPGGWCKWNPLPEPELVFGHVQEHLMKAGVPVPEPPSYRSLLADGIAINSFSLNTRAMSFLAGNRKHIGFEGRCEYLLSPSLPPPVRLWMHLLAGLAFYTGVGDATAWGMGQVRREPADSFYYRGHRSVSQDQPFECK